MAFFFPGPWPLLLRRRIESCWSSASPDEADGWDRACCWKLGKVEFWKCLLGNHLLSSSAYFKCLIWLACLFVYRDGRGRFGVCSALRCSP
ncbi:hypothetical protein BDA96_01G500100 [Sorghum bicolor]|uniref:Uncharacterized protein n=2 Tax=Sorghum bicolor TaxID=4558 RepID=A0A921V2I1_SORBI|nr:hypothetical protein BDA96_01G500100 [Sorghum bicolor]OQU93063.1 hypothetical protein SORBI_3001G469150 [Sorghum bicolor]